MRARDSSRWRNQEKMRQIVALITYAWHNSRAQMSDLACNSSHVGRCPR